MKPKILLAGAALVTCVLPVCSDEKDDAKPPAPPVTIEPKIPDLQTEPYGDSFFVIPVLKDKSDFTIKPPPGAVIENPALRIMPRQATPPAFALPEMPLLSASPGDFASSRKLRVINAPLSLVLQTISEFYKAKIVTCSAPEKPVDNPKITMWVGGKTTDEMLDSLKVLGLVWRKIGDTYFVAWSENDLPPAQK